MIMPFIRKLFHAFTKTNHQHSPPHKSNTKKRRVAKKGKVKVKYRAKDEEA